MAHSANFNMRAKPAPLRRLLTEVRACRPDCALPHGPDPALQASRLRDPQRRLEPVTQVVPHQPTGRSYPVVFTHHEPGNIHMAR